MIRRYPKTENENQVNPSEAKPCEPPNAFVKVKGNGNSTSTSFSWSNITKKIPEGMILGIALAIVIVESAALFFEWRTKAVSSDLATYNAQEARIQQEINKQLLVILNCRRSDK